jgi:hypothetical protein
MNYEEEVEHLRGKLKDLQQEIINLKHRDLNYLYPEQAKRYIDHVIPALVVLMTPGYEEGTTDQVKQYLFASMYSCGLLEVPEGGC